MPFSAKYRCSDCQHEFERVTERDPRKGGRAPSCPECKKNKHPTIKSISKSNIEYTQEKLDKNQQEITESKKFPAMGQSIRTKAIDATAEIVMKDYGMTDVNIGTNLREGDNCAPKLRPDLEQKVDSVFKPQPNKVMGMQHSSNINRALMQQINSGAFKNQGGYNDVVAKATVKKMPTTVIGEYNGKPT